ncbi:MAG: 6-carboxytetrahydropterin synthase, partial [Natronospirillum sp.]
VVDVTFYRPELDPDDLIVDIGLASETLKTILAPLNFQNLDELSDFSGRNTTTEFMARQIFERFQAAIAKGVLGPTGQGLTHLKVTLGESHIAWAAYRGEL